ncbi:MAG: hypothetical protein AB4426_22895 [Xenococcaceae cyanobacterium]
MTIKTVIIRFKYILLERIVTFSLVGIMLIVSVFISGYAQASLTTKAVAMDDSKTEIDKFVLDPQRYIDKVIVDSQKAIDQLSEELERVVNYTKFTARASFKRDMAATQRALEDASQALAKLATDTKRSAEDFSDELQAQIQQDIKTVDRALEDAAQAVKDFAQSP